MVSTPTAETETGRAARLLVRHSGEAALATMLASAPATPYASLVTVAPDTDGSPLLLLSDLAEHTKNLKADARVSLLFAAPPRAGEDPLARARVTVLGRAQATTDPLHRDRFLARHPEAAFYAGFKDFRFYRVSVERAHLVAGFGRIHWIEPAAFLAPGADAIAGIAAEVIGHMNSDHLDSIRLYAERLLRRAPQREWKMAAVDPDGCDLVAGEASARLDFESAVTDGGSVRAELVRLARLARSEP
jgi:putative heme iron utilization protein